MKTINFKSYSEKLKINPVNLKEFDNIKPTYEYWTKFDIDKLSSFDIVKSRNDLFFMVFLKDTNLGKVLIDTHLDKIKKHISDIDRNMIISIDKRYGSVLYIFFSSYQGNLNIHNHEYDIVSVWKAPNNISFEDNDLFYSESIMSYIMKYNYIPVFESK